MSIEYKTKLFCQKNFKLLINILGTPHDSYYLSSGHIGPDLTGNGHNLVIQGASTFAHTEGPQGETELRTQNSELRNFIQHNTMLLFTRLHKI